MPRSVMNARLSGHCRGRDGSCRSGRAAAARRGAADAVQIGQQHCIGIGFRRWSHERAGAGAADIPRGRYLGAVDVTDRRQNPAVDVVLAELGKAAGARGN